MYPELGPRVGYAVTCVCGLPDPSFKRLSFADMYKAIENSPKPAVLVIKQAFPEEIKNINGLLGENMMTACKFLGAVGVITDGPSRDVDEVRQLGIQYMLTGVSPGHGNIAVHAVNVPVEVCGMSVSPGDIIHMDENGAVKFPKEYLKDVVILANKLREKEQLMEDMIKQAKSAEEIAKIIHG
jgi:4-hydroxy-4-methyl-2-oxoglutarate aldolase